MGLLGREIVQSRTYIDPNQPDPPELNYKEAFPITVFKAVRAEIDDEDSITLDKVLEDLNTELNNRQPIIPAKSASYLMTYAGLPGAVGSIPITQNIPWNPKDQSHNTIPTAKAVGDLMQKLGLVDQYGNLMSKEDRKIRWADIIGRPNIYEEMGMNNDGFITQKGITKTFNDLKSDFDKLNSSVTSNLDRFDSTMNYHLTNYNNPHKVTAMQVGAPTTADFNAHANNKENPHDVTKAQVGLSNVDNTSDMDKPISTLAQAEIDKINTTLAALIEDEGSLVFVKHIEYDQRTGVLSITYRNDTVEKILIPIDGLVDEIGYDEETKDLIITELGLDDSGEHQRVRRLSLSDLYIRYFGSTSKSIDVKIEGLNLTGNQTIRAEIIDKGVTDDLIDDEAVITRTIADKAVTTSKIRDFNVTLDKLATDSVDTIKVVDKAIVNRKIGDRAINGRTLFSVSSPNKILGVTEKNGDPIWTQTNEEMIGDDSISTRTIIDESVTAEKLAANAVITEKINDAAVTTDKLDNDSVTADKIADHTIETRNVQDNLKLPGTPEILVNPPMDSNNMQIPSTNWIRDLLEDWVFENKNIADRAVDGRTLFSSSIRHRALVTLRAGSDPVWGQIDEDMLATDSVITEKIKDLAITKEKLADKSIEHRHLNKYIVEGDNIAESAVSLDKIIPSENAYMILATGEEKGHPRYSKIYSNMIAPNAVTGTHIQDRSVPLSKLESSELSNRIVGVKFQGNNPEWMQVNTNMIEDRAVTPDKIDGAKQPNYILATTVGGQSPLWVKIFNELIDDNVINARVIADKALESRHFKEASVQTEAIEKYAVTSDKIAPGAVNGTHIFTSPVPLRVLGVGPTPYSPAEWLQVETEMIKDEAVTGDKLFRSEHPYRVMVATQAGKPPEYQRITSDFIVDYSINPEKLEYDFTLLGTPKLTVEPRPDADNHEIASTRWVRDCVLEMLHNFETLYGTIYNEMLTEACVHGWNLFRSTFNGPRLLGVTDKGEEPEYLLVEEAMIVDGSITKNKVQRDLPLLGSPTVEIRPVANASDATGGGKLIPDCQWVLDRIGEASAGLLPGPSTGTGGTGGTASDVLDGSISTEKIQDRAVTGLKMFTSTQANKVLAVLEPNTDAQYTKILESMFDDSVVSARALYKADEDETVLITKKANKESSWGKIGNKMIETDAITTDKIKNYQVTNEKIQNGAVTKDKIKEEPFVDNTLLMNNAVTVDKIQDGSVERSKIKNKAIDSTKLDKDLVLDGAPTVVPNNRYETPMLRNVVISPNAPSGGNPGDIWIRYV